MSWSATAVRVLLVDDNLADIELARETLKENQRFISFLVATDGQQALEQLEDFLNRAEPLPDLILLDLNMPRLDGHGFLTQMRARDELQTVPVVILTSSEAECDVVKSYRLGANCYVNKPVGLEEFQSVLRSVEHFWLRCAKLP